MLYPTGRVRFLAPMPCEIIPDTLDLEMETLEAINPDPSQAETFRAAYPFPRLRKTGTIRSLSFRTIILTNEFVSATIAIDLGGRLIALHDKRTGTDILPLPKTLAIEEESDRGATVPYGLEVLAGNGQRPNSLGPVEFVTQEPEGQWDEATLMIHELRAGSGLGWQAIWSLSPDSPILRLNCSLINRTTDERSGVSGLQLKGVRGQRLEFDGVSVWHEPNRQTGLAVLYSPGTFDKSTDEALHRRSQDHPRLVPHQVDSWEVGIMPISGMSSVLGASEVGAISHEVGQLVMLMTKPLSNAKLLIEVDGKPLETTLDLSIDKLERVDLSAISGNISRCVLMTEKKEVVLSFPSAIHSPSPGTSITSHLRSSGWRGFGHWQLAAEAIRQKDFDRADEHLENSLLYNGDDPLTWWLKAVIRRLNGDEGERPELLNAHFLSPLEPALRCESFLGQNEQGKDPSPLLAPLARHPEALIDITCMLIEVHLIEEATRLIDEALRHREQPMLRYLWAWLHLSRTSMEFEAGKHVQIAEQIPFEPPFPWRQVEKRALTDLHARFPDMPGLKRWFELADIFIQGDDSY